MGKLDELRQDLEGKADELQGEFEQQTGHGVKGGAHKLQGKIKQKTAPLQDTDTDNDALDTDTDDGLL